MNHPESEYINAGHRYERAKSPAAARAEAQYIRAMLMGENPKDLPEARALIERGRSEARTRA